MRIKLSIINLKRKGIEQLPMITMSTRNFGECTFFKIKNLSTIDHTFVDPDIRGQNVAAYLIKIIVEQARNENVKIIPLCSFAKKEFMKIDEYKDILY